MLPGINRANSSADENANTNHSSGLIAGVTVAALSVAIIALVVVWRRCKRAASAGSSTSAAEHNNPELEMVSFVSNGKIGRSRAPSPLQAPTEPSKAGAISPNYDYLVVASSPEDGVANGSVHYEYGEVGNVATKNAKGTVAKENVGGFGEYEYAAVEEYEYANTAGSVVSADDGEDETRRESVYYVHPDGHNAEVDPGAAPDIYYQVPESEQESVCYVHPDGHNAEVDPGAAPDIYYQVPESEQTSGLTGEPDVDDNIAHQPEYEYGEVGGVNDSEQETGFGFN